MLKHFLYIMLVWLTSVLQAQVRTSIFIDGELTGKEVFADSLERDGWINKRLVRLWTSGYLFSTLDSMVEDHVYIHRGERLTADRQNVYIDHSDSGKQTLRNEKEPFLLIRAYSNNGYPFVRLKLDSVTISDASYSSFYSLNPGPEIRYDSLALLSKIRVNRSYLEHALEAPRGNLFSERTYRQLPDNIRRIPFLSLKKPPDIAFENGKSTIFLELAQEPSSAFEGVLGLLPRQSADGSMVVTGYLDLELGNLFQSGIGMHLIWNRFADQSQRVNLAYHHPFFLSSKLFLDMGFDLLKQDTTYITRSWKLGLGTHLSRTMAIRLHYENAAGSLITADAADLQQGFADYQTDLYAFSLGHARYSDAFDFGHHLRFHSGVTFGDKKLMANSELDANAYDSLKKKTLLIKAEGVLKYQFPVFTRTALYHEVRSAAIFNDQILNNEIARIGGLRTMRGFNENFFFAQHFALSRIELRQYFERRSFLMLFYDQLFYAQDQEWDQPVGFGVGLNLNTSTEGADSKKGLFTFALAIGTAQGIPLDFANVKVHLGYTTKF